MKTERMTTTPHLESRRPTGDVGLLLGTALGLPLYALTVAVAGRLPAYYRELLLERGWVMHAIMLPTCIALAILILKAVGLRLQRRAFEATLIPADPARLAPDDVPAALEHLDQLRRARAAQRMAPSFLLERARRALEHYAARRDVEETAAFHAGEADADANALGGSLGMVKVLIWAIPILGFIGTVIGIGAAVVGFSKSLDGASQLDAIKGSLGDVTTGLAVAFDTTLVSLVASIVVMLPMSLVQKADEQLLSDVDDRCNADVLRRLAVQKQTEPATLVHAAPPSIAFSEELRTAIETAIGAPLASMLTAHGRLLEKMSVDREVLLGGQAALADHLGAFAAAANSLGPAVERAVLQLELATSLADRTTTSMRRNEDQLGRELGASRQLLQILAAGLGAEVGTPPARTHGHAYATNGAASHGAVAALAEE